MANESKRSLFSSLFGRGKRQNKETEEAAVEARQKLERRIQQVLSEMVEAPKVAVEANHLELTIVEEEPENVAEVLPITASALQRRRTPVSADFWPTSTEVERPYAVNQHW